MTLIEEIKSNIKLQNPTYLANLLGFINCIISQRTKIDERMKMREEFLGNIAFKIVKAS